MTDPIDVPRDYHLSSRWRALAEKRLAHLVELYESGRWRKYHSEAEFMTIIRASRDAVETWHRLAPPPGRSAPSSPNVRQDEVVALLQDTASLQPRADASERADDLSHHADKLPTSIQAPDIAPRHQAELALQDTAITPAQRTASSLPPSPFQAQPRDFDAAWRARERS